MSHRQAVGEPNTLMEHASGSTGPLSGTIDVQDVEIPIHLLQGTGNLGNRRERGESLSWEPLPARPLSGESRFGSFARRNTRGSGESPLGSFTRRGTRESRISPSEQPSTWLDYQNGIVRRPRRETSTATVEKENSEPENTSTPFGDRVESPYNERQLSYIPGSSDVISTTPRPSRPPTPIDAPRPFHAATSSIWTTTDPFSTRNNSVDVGPNDGMGPTNSSSGNLASADSDGRRRARRGTLASVIDAVVPDTVQRKLTNASFIRKSSMWETYEKAKKRGVQLQRNKWVQYAFEYTFYLILVCFVYFVLIGIPLWNGTVYWLWWVVAHKFVIAGGWSITLGIGIFYAFAPLLILFEKDPPPADFTTEKPIAQNVRDTALLIPCYKSANIIGPTLEAALKIFPASNIYVLANGNSPTPLDNTEEVCRPFGVNHIWSPIGSKLVAQFVGCYAAKSFKNVLMIDDDCALPDNFPVVSERLVGNVQCIGYTIKSVGPGSSKGNLCQQAQDLEYKLSGIQREFAGKIGSATFPHGAISLWNTEVLTKTFHEHPGFTVSEDWFFGHVARKLGSRIKMTSHIFVETETPSSVFFSGGGSRGGFGEMTIYSQRFKRWNFFFVNGMWYNMSYILFSWKLGFWEIGAKIFVFQEVYETLLYLLTPFILPISFYVRPSFCGYLFIATIVMYTINVIIFNEVHLRRKKERIGWVCVYIYYLPYKLVLTCINVGSCYWSLYKYARYFAKRHPKVVEDEKAIHTIIHLEEETSAVGSGIGRRLTVRTIRSTKPEDDDQGVGIALPLERITTSISPLERSNTIAQMISEPEPAHLRGGNQALGTPKMEKEGIAGTDYFFNQADPRFDAVYGSSDVDVDLEKADHYRRRKS